MMSKRNNSKLEAMLQDNASILSRFRWSTDARYKRCMVVVFIFLIFLLLFRYPIIRWINKLPEPPTVDLGRCEVKGDGKLEVGLVHISPASNSETVIISFSTNLPTNSFITIQYGTDSKMEYESFAASTEAKAASDSKFPYSYEASFLIRTPGVQYYYRIACDDLNSDTYSFYSWRAGSAWSPSLAFVSGALTDYALQSLTSSFHKLSLVAHIDDATSPNHSDDYLTRIQSVASQTPFLLVPNGDPVISLGNSGLTTHVFHIRLGPMDVVGFNNEFLNVSIGELHQTLKFISKQRNHHPWLVMISQNHSFCLPNATSKSLACRQLFHLLSEYKVDLYIAGSSLGYRRSWPIAYNGDALSSYHHAQGFVAVALGIRSHNSHASDPFKSSHIMKQSNSVTSTLLKIKLDSPGFLCLDVINTKNSMTLDYFCVTKRVAGEVGTTGLTYDVHVWLCLVIILSVCMLVVVVFRRKLYASLCRYMESDGGPPLYHGKLSSV